MGTWRFTGIYGFSEDENKHKTGQLLHHLKNTKNHPWVCGGDFNLMAILTEKKEGNVFNENEAKMFREALRWCDLMDLRYIGYDFTWSNNMGGDKMCRKYLIGMWLMNHGERVFRAPSFHTWKRGDLTIYSSYYV